MMSILNLFIVVFVVVFTNPSFGEVSITLKPARKNATSEVARKPSSEKPSIAKEKKNAQRELNSELVESTAKTRSAGQAMRPDELKKDKKKKRKLKRIISGPAETVNVPDGVDWDHNRKSQEDSASELSEKVNREFSKPPEE
jgi:hypothetical protein